MKIVCSADVLYAREAFSPLGDVVVMDASSISTDNVKNADILVVRSTVKVDETLLKNSSVKFIGTATIGFDHFDIPYFEEKGIRWCYAPGCNANSVAEYVVSALLCLAARHGFALKGKTIGIVGVGNVGRLVAQKSAALSMNVLLNDPPRQIRENISGPDWHSLDNLLDEADIVSMHVPLTFKGPYATHHMVNGRFFEKIKHGSIFFNTSRGGIVNTPSLIKAIEEGKVSRSVIDTWEGEPDFSQELLQAVDIGTPHIAGHSIEGKAYGTLIVYKQVCEFLKKKPSWSPESLFPPPSVLELKADTAEETKDESFLWSVVKRVYDVESDDANMRDFIVNEETLGSHFRKLRGNYPPRREFRFVRINTAGLSPELVSKLGSLGFPVFF